MKLFTGDLRLRSSPLNAEAKLLVLVLTQLPGMPLGSYVRQRT